MTYVCPECRTAKCLWRGVDVPGWEAVNTKLEPESERDVEWTSAWGNGIYGCGDCNWEGNKGDLIRLGLDGQPMSAIHPQQEKLV